MQIFQAQASSHPFTVNNFFWTTTPDKNYILAESGTIQFNN